jgi:hypothetical protein
LEAELASHQQNIQTLSETNNNQAVSLM